jgi:hypothetical protein
VICSSAGPLIGDRNSSARLDAPGLLTHDSMSLATWGTSAGSLQLLMAYGPVGALPLVCDSQPSGLAMKAMNFLAASSFSPSTVLGM